MTPHAPAPRSLLPLLLLAALAGFVLAACSSRKPVAPPEYLDEARTPTGSVRLEERITHAERLQYMTPLEVEELARRARVDFASAEDLSDYVAVLADRGNLGDAFDFLHQRAWAAVEDQGKAADSLSFAMGQLRWSACAQMAKAYLELRHDSGVFMIRALCLERAGDHDAAVENLRAAHEVAPLDRDILDELLTVMEQRSAAGPMPPGDREQYDRIMLRMVRRDLLERLFVHELFGYPPETASGSLGTLRPGGLTSDDIRDVIDSRARSYRHCYHLADQDSKRNKRLRGRAVIEFDIGGLGQVYNPRPVLSDWGDHPAGPMLNGCLMEQIGRLRFPAPRFGLQQVTRHEFAFQPD